MVTRDVLKVHEVANNSQDEHADDGVHGGAAAAHQAGAADDDRCDNIELHADTNDRRSNARTRGFDHPGQRAQSAGDYINSEHVPTDPDARQAHGFLIAADGLHQSSKRGQLKDKDGRRSEVVSLPGQIEPAN
jgi:hypothetical protein